MFPSHPNFGLHALKLKNSSRVAYQKPADKDSEVLGFGIGQDVAINQNRKQNYEEK